MPTINHFDYFTDIEQAFIRRRGKHLMIGPLDWALIESWQKREIPLRIVIQAIDEVFDSFEQRNEDKSNVRSLKYCSDAVERRFSAWSRAHVGKSETDADPGADDPAFSNVAVRNHIDECLSAFQIAERLPESVQYGLAEVRGKLVTIQEGEGSATELDLLDEEIEALILASKEQLLNPRLNETIDAKLAEFGFAGADAAADRIICEAVKDEYGIPRLSLFRL